MDEFDAYAAKIADGGKNKTLNLNNDQKGQIYGLFKQAKMGDNSASKPGMMSGFEARGKWDSWEANKGKSNDEAAAEYVELAKGFLGE